MELSKAGQERLDRLIERKYMSTKTISKRVALATVVALGAGVLSLVSVSSASAAVNVAVTPSNVSAVAVPGTMNIGTAVNTTGAPVQGASASSTAWASLGLLQVTNYAGTTAADNAQQAVLASNGKLLVYTALANAQTAAVFTVVNGTFSSAALTSDTAGVAYNNTGSTVVISDPVDAITATTQTASVVATPINAALPMIVTGYTNTGTGKQTAAVNAVTAVTSSGWTQIGQVNVTVSAASVSGTVSLTNSKVIYTLQAGGISAITTNINTATSASSPADAYYPALGTSAYNKVQYGSVVLKDAYGVALPAGNIVQATASNGAYVAFSGISGGNTGGPTSAGTSSSAITTTTASQVSIGFTVGASVSTASSTTVTLSYNGTVVGVLPFTFTGLVAKVVLSAAQNGLVGGVPSTSSTTPLNSFTITAKDSAGNNIAVNTGNTSYPTNFSALSSGTVGTGVGLNSIAYTTTATATSSLTGAFNCSATVAATGAIQLQYVNTDGSLVTSNALSISCSGAPASYSAKLDKSSYNPGDLATLTVTFKDASGSVAADTGLNVISSSAKTASVTGAYLSPANGATSNAATATDYTSNGVVSYKFVVGGTAGSYQAIADFPLIDAVSGAAQTVAYSINSTGTSLNDVLKGIVALIASINKQIAALAKLVTKK